jgi:alkylhydroperoxidase family enzyme
MDRATAITRGGPVSEQPLEAASTDALSALIDKVARHAYRVTDEEIDALLAAGYPQDALFDVIVAAAVGSGLARREAGLEAVGAWKRAHSGERRAGA